MTESSHTTTTKHTCFDGQSHSATCTSVETVTIGAHEELRSSNGAFACGGWRYAYFSVNHYEYGGFGNLLWHIWMPGQDRFNGCSVAVNWGPRSECQAYEGWQCGATLYLGAYWNASVSALDHYADRQTDYWITWMHVGQYTTYTRFYLQPNGHHWSNEWSQCNIC
ncbi:MAG: hypothetical protein M3Z28_01225 [Candidatus Dormibacteraeota bacterium]|nr:hypothetical protein [Candidatus Dormibacteraeota bacterium]